MGADRQPGQPGKRISRERKQAARPAKQKDKQGMEADRQPGQPGRRISRAWKQSCSQARRKHKHGMEADRRPGQAGKRIKAGHGSRLAAVPARQRKSREWKQTGGCASQSEG